MDVTERKVKITIRLDEKRGEDSDRAMGVGYQARMNRVLQTYAQMQIAQVRWFEGERDEVRRQAAAEAWGGRHGRHAVEVHLSKRWLNTADPREIPHAGSAGCRRGGFPAGMVLRLDPVRTMTSVADTRP